MLKVIHQTGSSYKIEGCPANGLEAVEWRQANGFDASADNEVRVPEFAVTVGIEEIQKRREHANGSANLTCPTRFAEAKKSRKTVKPYGVECESMYAGDFNSGCPWKRVTLPADVLRPFVGSAHITPEAALALFDALVDLKIRMAAEVAAEVENFESIQQPKLLLDALADDRDRYRERTERLSRENEALSARIDELSDEDDEDDE